MHAQTQMIVVIEITIAFYIFNTVFIIFVKNDVFVCLQII